MKNDSSTECWNKVGEEWYLYAQTNDFRMDFIMPFTLKQLGNVSGKMILDIGCGEGGYSRELARKGAIVTAVDCNEVAVNYSKLKAEEEQLNISHYLRNSNDLQDISDDTFDIVLSSMMLMDCKDFNGTVKEISRVHNQVESYLLAFCTPVSMEKIFIGQGETLYLKLLYTIIFHQQNGKHR
jgi:2-polyprenyl-3-methyl-5-hydroxy-6-metoxy-1,4-benzoquinol methylase